MLKRFVLLAPVAALGLALGTGFSAPASAAAAGTTASPVAATQIGFDRVPAEYARYRGRYGGWRGGWRGPRYGGWRGYRYGYRRHHYGAGLGIGLATGALIGGALAAQAAQPPSSYAADGNYLAYCSQKYRSFDPASGTYLGFDGQRHACQMP